MVPMGTPAWRARVAPPLRNEWEPNALALYPKLVSRVRRRRIKRRYVKMREEGWSSERHVKAAAVGRSKGQNDQACAIAVTGQSGEPVMRTSGIKTVRWRNWIVLLHLTRMRNPCVEGIKSPLEKCLPRVKEEAEEGTRWDLRNRPKKAVRHIAQKDAWRDSDRLRRPLRRRSNEVDIGNLGVGETPFSRRIPVRVEDKSQLEASGLGKPNSLCRRDTKLR